MEKFIDEGVIGNLGKLGLTKYEARVYGALVLLGEASVGDIYPTADVPRSAVYGALEKLYDRGIIEVCHEKPARYRALEPDLALEKLERGFQNAKKKALASLVNMYEAIPQARSEEAIWIVKGKENIDDKIEELISKAKKRILFGGTIEKILGYSQSFDAAKGKGVKIEFLVGKEGDAEELEGMGKVIFVPVEKDLTSQLDMSIMLVDEAFALFGATYEKEAGRKEDTAFWSDSLAFVSFLGLSMEQLIEYKGKIVSR